jgi:hypothetical protein
MNFLVPMDLGGKRMPIASIKLNERSLTLGLNVHFGLRQCCPDSNVAVVGYCEDILTTALLTFQEFFSQTLKP